MSVRPRPGPRLAAVWFADICGYSRLAARDEPGALELVALLQQLGTSEVEGQHGRVVKFIGDAVLAEFSSVRGAARAALALTQRFEQQARPFVRGVPLRVGLHLGEISESADGDVYGDGVNVAARLQKQAEPGTVLVSGDVWRQLRQLPEFKVDGGRPRLLRNVAGRIYTYVLRPAPPAATPEQPSGGMADRPGLLPPLRLVGRQPELELFGHALARLADGSGGTLLLAGEAGVGKTRLAQVLASEAAARQYQVAIGRAYPVESGVPYALIADALLPLARREAHTGSFISVGVDELSSLFPALRRSTDRGQGIEDPAEFKGRLLWTFTERLRNLTARSPLVLILDDVHWADASSLELLHFVARQTAHDPILIVCIYIDSGNGALRPLHMMEQSLLGIGVARLQRIESLKPSGVEELLSSAFDTVPEVVRGFAHTLHEWTGGNVFFVQEVLQSLVASGRLQCVEGRWTGWEIGGLELPRTVRHAVMDRLQRLSSAARAAASVLAVVGTRASYRLLRATTGVAEAELLSAVDELCSSGILAERVDDNGSVFYEFRHPIAREVVYRELGGARRARLHGAVAEFLEGVQSQTARDRVDDLAYHFSRAGAEEYGEKAVRYLTEAGIGALRRFANQEAADYLTHALNILTNVAPGVRAESGPVNAATPAAGDVLDSATRAVLQALARARQRLGDYAGTSALLERLLRDAELLRDNAAIASLRRRSGLNCFWSGRHEDAEKHLGAGVAAAQQSGDVLMEAHLELARGTCYQELGRAPEARERIGRAHAIAEEFGDEALRARTHRALLMLHTWIGPADEARRHGSLAVELAERTNEQTVAFFSHWTLAAVEGLTGHTDRMAHHIAHGRRLAESLGSPLLRLWVDELSIEYAWSAGEWDAGLEIGERAIALARALDQPMLLPRLLVWTSLIHVGRGEIEPAADYVAEAWALSGAGRSTGSTDVHTVVPAHIGRASVLLGRQQYAEAIAMAEAGLAIADRSGYPFWAIHRLLPIIAEAALYARDLERAARVDARLRAESQRLGHRLGLAWADACRALVVRLSGDLESGVQLLSEAVATLDAIPIVPDAARLRRQLAACLLEMGDRDAALRELTAAHAVLQRLRARPEIEKTRRMFAEFGSAVPVQAVD